VNKRDAILKYIFTPLGHITFWVVIYFFYAYFLGYGSTNTRYVNLFSAFLMPVTISISYFLGYYLIPEYLLVKKHRLFILYSVYTFILSISAIIISILYGLVYTENLKSENASPLTKTLPFIVLGVFFVVLIVVMLSLIMYNYRSVATNENLKNKILQTQLQLKEQELKFLKMQIHPHFLFNALNTIYGYALKKGDDAPEMILKLSNLLDYILYQVEKPTVLLQDEIHHLEDYVSLEKMRFHDTLEVVVEKSIEDSDMQVAPMLLIPFVENSFKHGTIIDGKLKVHMVIKTTAKTLDFEIVNSSTRDQEVVPGIGLENSRKRLAMLYPDKYILETKQEENQFKVTLKMYDLNQLEDAKIN
jgi:two-component system LytT family sensor kinase